MMSGCGRVLFQIFTTVHDGQTELCVLIYSGDSAKASKNRLLGQFQLVNLPPAPYGVPQIEVSIGLHLEGVLIDSHSLGLQ